MLREYIALNNLIRRLINEIIEIYVRYSTDDSPDLSDIQKDILQELWDLREKLPRDLDQKSQELEEGFEFISNLGERDVENLGLRSLSVVSDVLEKLEIYYSNKSEPESSNEIIDLLHPVIIEKPYNHFLKGDYHEAVLYSMLAVFDHLKQRTGLRLDGYDLAQIVFDPKKPILIVSTMHSESGRSEQTGFMNLLKGAYSYIRNPNAHSQLEKPSRELAAQNLIFASFLAKRIDDAKKPSEDNND